MPENSPVQNEICTTSPNRWLNRFSRNVASQYGEDGIIETVLEVMKDCNKWCVEFGAADGKYVSNTFNLIQNRGYSAVLIEPNPARFKKLIATYRSNGRVIPIKAFVGFEKENCLDTMLKTTKIPRDFDLLSIDVDGNDYHCWKAVEYYRPKIVIIEFNPTIPTPVEFIQEADMRVSQGTSILSISKLAKLKGYELVAVTLANAIFVRSSYFHLFSISDNSVQAMRSDESAVTYFFSGYDGTVYLKGCRKLVWHDIPFNESRVQQLPKWLRDYPMNYSKIKRILVRVYRGLRTRNII